MNVPALFLFAAFALECRDGGQRAGLAGQADAGPSPPVRDPVREAGRCAGLHHLKSDPWRTLSSLRPSLSFRYTQGLRRLRNEADAGASILNEPPCQRRAIGHAVVVRSSAKFHFVIIQQGRSGGNRRGATSIVDAVDGSSTGTRVPRMRAPLRPPRFRGATHADDHDNRFGHR
jgi:hypothetical protein